MTETRTPTYKVTITSDTNGKVWEKNLQHGVSDDANAVVDTKVLDGKPNDYNDRVTVRQKTAAGHCAVFARWKDNAYHRDEYHASPDKDVSFTIPQGGSYTVSVEALPEAQWRAGQSIDFPAPKASVTRKTVGNVDGIEVTFEPAQAAIYTIAPATGTKPECLPSLPFPPNQAFKKMTLFIPIVKTAPDSQNGQLQVSPYFLAEWGAVRLGVRGAGMAAVVAIPEPGQVIDIEPKHFKVSPGAAQPHWLQPQKIQQKYQEKVGSRSPVQYA